MVDVEVDGVSFVEEWAAGVSTPDRLAVMKPRELIEAYLELLTTHQGGRMVELGIREGGSTALMALAGQPSKMVAIELDEAAPALTAFIDQRGLDPVVRPYFGVDQGDRARLDQIMTTEFGDEPLDLVIDDASHLYDPTLASFEVLFPRLRPGGLYIIEDWGWQYRMSSTVARTAADPSTPRYGKLLQRMQNRAMENRLLEAVVTDPDGELAQAVLRAEAAGQLTPDQQQRVAEARRRTAETGSEPSRFGHRPLAALAAQLMLALACGDAVAELTLDPHWTTVRRGDVELGEGWALADAFVDSMGLLA
jgi:predicted O-methyltransferase YrrM